MTDDQISRWGQALLIKISVITGWVLPVDELLTVLVDQFKKKMTEGYANCNPEEVEYAFRNFGSFVKDWGKQINLNLIDEVMRPYLQKRREQSDEEERSITAPLPGDQAPMTHFGMLRWLATEIRFIQTGKPVDFVSLPLYDYFDKKGMIRVSKEEKFAYLDKAAEWRGRQLEREWQDRGTPENQQKLQQFRAMRDRGYFTGDEVERLKATAKKLLFFDLAMARKA